MGVIHSITGYLEELVVSPGKQSDVPLSNTPLWQSSTNMEIEVWEGADISRWYCMCDFSVHPLNFLICPVSRLVRASEGLVLRKAKRRLAMVQRNMQVP